MSVLEETLPSFDDSQYSEDYADIMRRFNKSGEFDCNLQQAKELERLRFSSGLRDEERFPVGCPTYWDSVLCWPATPAGTTAVMHCLEEFNGVKYDASQNATRFCHTNGTWDNYTDYSQCQDIKHLPEHDYLEGTEVPSIIYYVGYTVSLVALGLAVWVFLYFKDLRCLRNTIHINLMCTYMMAALMWILTLTLQLTATPDYTSCIFLVVLLHYFALTNFFWMLVEGLYLYMLVVETFTRENIKLRVYLLLGWAAPAVFIMAWAIVRSTVSQSPDDESISLYTGNNPHCSWLGEQIYDWIYQAPACVVLVVNLLFLFRIMWVLITKLRSANTLETQQYRKASKALLVLIPLLGITYLLVIMGPTEGISRHIFDIARALLLSTQGFTVALFYCFLNTEVQNTLRHHIERWKTARSLGGGSRRNYSKEWSPRSRTESIRLNSLYSQPASHHGYRKRESTASETTTTTLLGTNPQANVPTSQINNKNVGNNVQRSSISPFLQPGITENDV